MTSTPTSEGTAIPGESLFEQLVAADTLRIGFSYSIIF
jgi:hypothetical protein